MTQTTQSPSPATSNRPPAIPRPRSYGMNAMEDFPDLFRAPRGSAESASSSAIPNSPMQEGVWYLEPSYANSFSFLYNPKHKVTLSRSMNELTLPANFYACSSVLQTRFFDEDIWLQCIGLVMPGDSKDKDSFAVGVVDYQDFNDTYIERRIYLETKLVELGIKLPPLDKYAFLVPRFTESIKLNLWLALQQKNYETGYLVYDGIVAKKAASKYECQMDDFKLTTPWWHFHKFQQ